MLVISDWSNKIMNTVYVHDIFELEKISTKATYRDPIHVTTGFSYIFVNGELAVEQDCYEGVKSGDF